MVEQVGGKRMAQRMRRQRDRDARHPGPLLDDDPEHDARHAAAAPGHEQVVRALAAQYHAARLLQVALQPLAGLDTKRQQALLAAPAGDAHKVFNPASSVARRPLAYISSSIARSRRPSGVPGSGPCNRASTWVSVMVLGTRSRTRAAARRAVGSALMRRSRSAQ